MYDSIFQENRKSAQCERIKYVHSKAPKTQKAQKSWRLAHKLLSTLAFPAAAGYALVLKCPKVGAPQSESELLANAFYIFIFWLIFNVAVAQSVAMWFVVVSFC